MHELFRNEIESLHPTFERLLAMQPVQRKALPKGMPCQGIYLFSDGIEHLYVGRSDRMRQRLMEHGRASSTHFSASFAFLIARRQAGDWAKSMSREQLVHDQRFLLQFDAAKENVRGFDIRYVEESEPTRQALLEIYAAVVLKTPFNTFENH